MTTELFLALFGGCAFVAFVAGLLFGIHVEQAIQRRTNPPPDVKHPEGLIAPLY